MVAAGNGFDNGYSESAARGALRSRRSAGLARGARSGAAMTPTLRSALGILAFRRHAPARAERPRRRSSVSVAGSEVGRAARPRERGREVQPGALADARARSREALAAARPARTGGPAEGVTRARAAGVPGRGLLTTVNGVIASSLVFLTPFAGLVILAAIVPLVSVGIAGRRIARARSRLGLSAPPRTRRLPVILALLFVCALLALAAMQPAVRSTTTAKVRTDAQAIFVLDISRSMLAARSPHSPDRLARAKQLATAMREAIPDVPSGVATLTDRVLPSLFPNSDPAVFDATVAHAVGIEQPPPANVCDVIATSLAALGSLGTQNYFPPTARRRLVVALTDGESRPFDARQVASRSRPQDQGGASRARPCSRAGRVRLPRRRDRVGLSREPDER